MTPDTPDDLVASFSGFDTGPTDADLRSVSQLAADLRDTEEERELCERIAALGETRRR